MKKHVVFDLDGTLTDSQGAVFEAVQVLIKEFFDKDFTLEEVIAGYSPKPQELAANFGLTITDPTDFKKLLHRWGELCGPHHTDSQLFAGIKELLQTLAAKGHSLYVWTNRDRSSTLAVLDKLGIRDHFSDIRCADDTVPKPDPAGILEMLGETDPDRVWMIGDTIADVEGGLNFGANTIGALWCQYAIEEKLHEHGAHHLVRDPKHCLDIIG